MGNVRFPVSGNVNQTINPWTWAFNTCGNQIGFFNLNIDLGHSSNPDAERVALDVASYGKQLGRIEDVIDILVRRLKNDGHLRTPKRRLLAIMRPCVGKLRLH